MKEALGGSQKEMRKERRIKEVGGESDDGKAERTEKWKKGELVSGIVRRWKQETG